MSDTFENITGQNQGAKPVCRVAYTINNTQPVISTIISNQPLFYMDFDCGYDDEDDLSFDAADLDLLGRELETLQSAIDAASHFAEGPAQASEDKVFEFLEDAQAVTTAQSGSNNADINALQETLRESRLATAYLASVEEHGVDIRYSSQIETSHYDRAAGLIFINPNVSFADQQLLLTQELRRQWQHRQGALVHPLMFHPDNAVLVHRAQVADLAVSMVRVAWELQLSGDKAAWERIENSSMADLGRAFAREAFLDFRTINNGQAPAAVFEAWFLSERCRMQDKILINQMLSDHKGYVFDLDEAEQNITPTLIAALGEMPFGKNYLAEHAMTIMDDAIFTEVRDRSNANFLWFIKFERSFRETEQELQTSFNNPAESVRSSANIQTGTQNDARNTQSGGPQSAEVISLFTSESEAEQKTNHQSSENTKRLASKDRDCERNRAFNVVYLCAQPGE